MFVYRLIYIIMLGIAGVATMLILSKLLNDMISDINNIIKNKKGDNYEDIGDRG